MTARVYVVGTGTGVGKTTVVRALMELAARRGTKVLPYKPAASEAPGTVGDPERLLPDLDPHGPSPADICPFRAARPVAPGLVDGARSFLATAVDRPPVPALAAARLHELELRHRPDLVLIEGAGGIHVPMPGGTWQPDWIRALADHTLVVGADGLGTINHTLLTIDALRAIARPPLGFVLSVVDPDHDPSRPDNAATIAAASGIRHLGTLPHRDDDDAIPDQWFDVDVLSSLSPSRRHARS